MNDKTYWDEQWEPVYFEGIEKLEKYEISNYGRIKRWITKKNDWIIQKPSNVNGYAYFSFRTEEDIIGKKRVTKSLHRLVAEKFISKSSDLHDNVIHIDFNKCVNL